MNMMPFSSSQQIKLPHLMCMGVIGMSLTACDASNSSHEHVSSQHVRPSEMNVQIDSGKKLSDVAGQATLPVSQHAFKNAEISEDALRYVGRYHTRIACVDTAFNCPQGSAEYILTLLEDGTAHQTLVNPGRLGAEGNIKEKSAYRQDNWTLDKTHNQIVIELNEGVDIYYKIEPDQDLKLNLARTIDHEKLNPRRELEFGLIAPKQEYILEKRDD